MKELIVSLLISIMLISCDKAEKPPKHDLTVFGYYLKEAQDKYYLIQCSSIQGGLGKEIFSEGDSISIDGQIYHDILFAKIDQANLKEDFNYINYNFNRSVVLWVNGSFERKQVPGEGLREYLVLDNIVGIE